ncbi:MAG: YihY/virulence factor BrkB family protein [bacterium]
MIKVLWKQPLSAVSQPLRSLFWAGRAVESLIRDVTKGQMSLRAMSMVYSTLLSIVPLLALSFAVLKGFGVHNQLEPIMLELLAPLGDKAEEITHLVLGFVSNMKVGVLGAVGLGVLVYTVLSLIHKIVSAIEFTWDNRGGRSSARRLLDYLAILMAGPLVLFALVSAVSGAVDSELVQSLLKVSVIGTIYGEVLKWVPLLLVVLALSFVYWFVPAAGVRWYAALAGGLFAGLAWKLSGWVFAAFVVGSGKYAAIYSAFASILLFMIWVYVSWLILLLGSRFAYYLQFPQAMHPNPALPVAPPADTILTGLNVIRAIGEAFQRHALPPKATAFEKEFEQPKVIIDYVLERLMDRELIRADAEAGYFPARPMRDIHMSDVVQALWKAKDGVLSGGREIQLMNDIDQSVRKRLEGQTLENFIEGQVSADSDSSEVRM